MTTTLAEKPALAPQMATAPIAPSIERGKPISICSSGPGALDYFLYVPTTVHAQSAVVVAIHGLRRSAAQQIFQLKALAEIHGTILFAPLFAREQFRHFQTLSHNEEGAVPEEVFDNALEDCLARLELTDPRLLMFGFSGGAQFAHRYALLGSRRFDKMALMAPGWFTMPDADLPFPYGLGASELLGDRIPDPARALSCPTLVIVGERDTKRNGSLNQDPLVDEHQGMNRLARCESWVSAMQARQGGEQIEDLALVKGGGHNLEKMIHARGMGERIFSWFAA